MKLNKLFSLIILTSIFALSVNANSAYSSQPSFDVYWTKFRAAIIKKDKAAAYSLTRTPVYMPYGNGFIKTRAQFFRRYKEVFSEEADAAKCFAKAKPERIDAKKYEVACGFKDDPDGRAGQPLVYTFELTAKGWKFTRYDNINE